MYKITIQLLFSFLLIQGSLYSQSTPQIIIEDFFERLEKEGVETALDSLYGTNKWVNNSPDLVIQLSAKMKMELENEDYIGKMHGHELILTKTLGASVKLYSYLVKYDRQPIRFTFILYKPKDKWMLYSFKYDGTIPDEIEESAKLYYEINKY